MNFGARVGIEMSASRDSAMGAEMNFETNVTLTVVTTTTAENTP